MDLALQIALGSSTQVALLVAPLLVLVGLFLGQQMNLVFSPFEVAGARLDDHRDGDHHPGRGIPLVRGGPAPGPLRHGRGGLLRRDLTCGRFGP